MSIGSASPLVKVSVRILVGAGGSHLACAKVTVHPGNTRGGVGNVVNHSNYTVAIYSIGGVLGLGGSYTHIDGKATALSS